MASQSLGACSSPQPSHPRAFKPTMEDQNSSLFKTKQNHTRQRGLAPGCAWQRTSAAPHQKQSVCSFTLSSAPRVPSLFLNTRSFLKHTNARAHTNDEPWLQVGSGFTSLVPPVCKPRGTRPPPPWGPGRPGSHEVLVLGTGEAGDGRSQSQTQPCSPPATATLSSHSIPREREGLHLSPLSRRVSQGTGLRVAWSGQNQDSDPGPTQSLLGVLCIRSVSASAWGLPLPSPGHLFPTELAVGPGGHTGWGWGMLIRASHAAPCYLLRSWNAPHTTAVPSAKAGPRAPSALPPLLTY